MGIVNSHFSLLPELRGADPISFAILEGKKETGVSLMVIVEAMDEGPLLAQRVLKLDGSETTPSLTKTLIDINYSLLDKYLEKYISKELKPKEQRLWKVLSGKETGYTHKLTKNDGIIDWNKPSQEIEKEIRAYIGWPKSQTKFNQLDVVITEAKTIEGSGNPGELFIINKQLAVYCGSGALLIKKLTPVGKKSMDSRAFLAGYSSRLGL
jgi:methionyl-tRNA formyltransferase